MLEYFTDAVTKHYFDFNGRARRAAFWYFVLVYVIIVIVLDIVQGPILHMLTPALTGIFGLLLLLPNLGINVRRLHDTNRSGWWILLWLIPVVGWIILIIWYCEAGNTGANQHGPDPKAAT
ncbi:MAG: DUF805 domain-containing protein [Rhizomicrobium sp.]